MWHQILLCRSEHALPKNTLLLRLQQDLMQSMWPNAAEEGLPQAELLEPEGSDLSREAQLVTGKGKPSTRSAARSTTVHQDWRAIDRANWRDAFESRKRRSSAPEPAGAQGVLQPHSPSVLGPPLHSANSMSPLPASLYASDVLLFLQ